MMVNAEKCKLILSNTKEKYNNCTVFCNIFSTEFGFVKITRCVECSSFCADALRAMLVDGNCVPYLCSACYSKKDGEIIIKFETAYDSVVITVLAAMSAVFSEVQRDNLTIDFGDSIHLIFS